MEKNRVNNVKLIFPTGYEVGDIYNSNIDAYAIVDEKKVYSVTFFTIRNIESLMGEEETMESLYFWSQDMIIVKDLRIYTLKNTIWDLVKQGSMEIAGSEFSSLNEIFSKPLEEYDFF